MLTILAQQESVIIPSITIYEKDIVVKKLRIEKLKKQLIEQKKLIETIDKENTILIDEDSA
jgi:hypothetical protein